MQMISFTPAPTSSGGMINMPDIFATPPAVITPGTGGSTTPNPPGSSTSSTKPTTNNPVIDTNTGSTGGGSIIDTVTGNVIQDDKWTTEDYLLYGSLAVGSIAVAFMLFK